MIECAVERCRAEAYDPAGWAICFEDLQRLRGDLEAVPELVLELDSNLAREGSSLRIGSRATTVPLPFDSASSEAIWVLRSTLSAWVREVVDTSAGPLEARPQDALPAMAAWLVEHRARLAVLDVAGQAVEEVSAAVRFAERTLDRVRERVFVGRCGAPLEAGQCSTVLYAEPGRSWVQCPRCRACSLVEARLSELREALEDRLLTVREIAVAVAWLGEAGDTRRVENRIYKWVERGRIVAHGHDERGRPAYRFGAVLGLLRSSA